MKKFLSVLLSVLMLLTCMVPLASAAPAVEDVQPTATAALNWLDAKIKDAASEFNAFIENIGVDVGLSKIESVDDLIAYKDMAVEKNLVAQFGGDFANLGSWNLLKKRSEVGDIGFLNGLIEFMAANKAVFGKVFSWSPDGTPFDYGKIGEFIESENYTNAEVKDFYNTYLKNGYDIQAKFTAEIAREMGYTIPEGESFDNTLNNGIKAGAIGTFLRSLLKSDASLAAFDAFSTKDTTKDVYAIIKEYIQLLQNDYKDDADAFLGNIFSMIADMVGSIKTALDGVEIPVLTIGYTGNKTYATYTPTSTDMNDYMPTIYANDQAKTLMEQYEVTLPIDVKASSELQLEENAADKALVSTASESWGKDVVVDVSGANKFSNATGITFPFTIDLKTVETAVISSIQTAVNNKGINGVATLSDANATFSYKAYKDGDSLAVQMKIESATAKATITSPGTGTATIDLINPNNTTVSMDGIYALANDTVKTTIVDFINNNLGTVIGDPAVVTIIFNNLSGKSGINLDEINAMLGYLKANPEYDEDLLDFFKNNRYVTYKGAVGQANRILVDAAKMILTPEGIADLGLQEGGNEYFDSNVTKVREKALALVGLAGDAIDALNELKEDENLKDFVEGIDLTAFSILDFSGNVVSVNLLGVEASVDLTSNESMYASLIKAVATFIDSEDETVAAIVNALKAADCDTLDEMLIAVINVIAPQAAALLPEDIGYTFTPIVYSGNAENDIMTEATKAIFAGVNYALGLANTELTKLAKTIDEDLVVNFQLGVSFNANNWKASLEALVDRFISLTDGLFISPITGSGVYGKLGDILYKALPMDSMFSNVNSGADVAKIPGYVFTDALAGNFSNLLSLAETKADAVAGGVSINKALINASERIVSAFFPTTVSAASYEDADGVQEYFTGAANDPQIAARNMADINTRKADLVPCALNLLKESGILAAVCTHSYGTEDTVVTPSTCKTHGAATMTCKACGKALSGTKELPLDPANHEGPFETRNAKEATVDAEGYTGDIYCAACSTKTASGTAIAKLDPPQESQNFFQRVIASVRSFFENIRSFFANLFRF